MFDPPAKHRQPVAPPLIFQPQHQIAGDIAINQRRPRPVIDRRVRQARPAHLPRIDRDLERRSASRAQRIGQELQLGPQFRLKRAGPSHLAIGDQRPLRPDQPGHTRPATFASRLMLALRLILRARSRYIVRR